MSTGCVANTAGNALAGDWNSFSVLAVEMPVSGGVALRIDPEDAAANKGKCCNIDRLELDPPAATP